MSMLSPLVHPSDDDNGGDDAPRRPDADDVPKENPFVDPADINNAPLEETCQWWAEFTSIHGVYYMLERGHFQLWKTLAWTAVTLIAAVFLIVALVAEFQEYLKYDINTATQTVIPTALSFPQVTLCNANGGIDATLQNATGIEEPRNEEELAAIAQPLSDFILHTKFNGDTLDVEKAWTPIITPVGQCFSFVTKDTVSIPGITAGLNVWTWLDQANYPVGTDMAGVHVFANPVEYYKDGKISFQSSGSVIVPPGALSYAAIQRQDFQREEEDPWRNCLPAADGVSNSIEQCRMDCIMSATKAKCGCRLMGDDDKNYDYCNSTNLKCTSSIGDEDLSLCKTCSIPPCKEQVFSTRYSAGRVSQKMARIIEASQDASYDELNNNFVSVHINYDAIRYEKTTESKSTSTWQLVSNLGGNFGFFMGISMISLVELFVELFALRLLPRLWGDKRLYGIGQKKFD